MKQASYLVTPQLLPEIIPAVLSDYENVHLAR